MHDETASSDKGRLPAAALAATVKGINLRPGVFGDQLGTSEATLLIFLRHLG